MYEVFISHSSKDAKAAEIIRRSLEVLNIPCWIAPRDIPSGSNYAAEIPPAIRECTIFLILISENSVTSDQVKNELGLAAKNKKYMIPYRLDDVELPDEFDYHLNSRQWADAHAGHAKAIQNVIAQISQERMKQSPKPPTPEELEASKTFNEIVGIFVRTMLVALIILIDAIGQFILFNYLYGTDIYVIFTVLLHLAAFVSISLVIAPMLGGKRKFLQYFIDFVKDAFKKE